MSNENEKKGLFGRLTGAKKTKNNSCCCNVELEEISDEKEEDKNEKNSSKD